NPLELSGGECQRLSLAAALIQQPDILFLDEPTSYLDEARSQELFRDLESLPPQVTVVLVEHRLELVEHFCKRWICIDNGTISEQASWDEVLACTPSLELPETAPSTDRIVAPVVKDAEESASGTATAEKVPASSTGQSQPLLEIRSLSHRYGPPDAPSILHNISLSIEPGTITAIMGASGSGKTTLLKKIIRILPVEQNTVFLYGRDITSMTPKEYYQHIAYIPQNPEHLFLEDTVEAELAHGAHNAEEAIRFARLFSLEHRLKAHPFKLSEGEKRRLTLCIALSMRREFIIMDEPTYGLDREARHRLASYLSMPELSGTSILLVSHDSLFVHALAERANRSTKILWLSEGQFKEAD
uniref:ATP-binding cassette domain-containing protein n=1 Tax=Gracilinema caldarium TaxID=215591 RepID=UPI0026ECB828